jgi:pilus assembly protein FimV
LPFSRFPVFSFFVHSPGVSMIVRPSRPFHSQPRHVNRARRAALIAASAASVLLGTSFSSNAAAQASAASAPVAASDATATQYSVKSGQSLSDIAAKITGSNDRATREKMARALFDANPNAFMSHDPSRLRLGSVLNVPQVDQEASASAATAMPAVAASSPATAAPVVTASAPEIRAAPAEAGSNTTSVASGAEVSGAVTANTASGAAAASESQPASGTGEIAMASAPVTASAAASASASVPASAPAASAATPASAESAAPASGNGPIGWIIGVVVAIGLLLLAMRAGKRRRAVAVPEDDQVVPEPPVMPPLPEAPHNPTHDSHSHPATGAADLEGAAVQRGQGELNAVAASMENYDAAQAFDTPTEDTPPTSIGVDSADSANDGDNDDAARVTLSASAAPRAFEAKRAPFMPDAPSALHRDFTPPRPGAVEAALAAERAATERAAALERATREAIEREAAEREAAERESQKLATEAREAEARETEARESAIRDAAAREAAAREAAAHQAEAQAAAAREASAREAEAHAMPPAAHAEISDDDSYDDEPSSPASRFPQPKFPKDAIEALTALDFGLPPRQEAPVKNADAEKPEIAPAPITPQPIADPAVFDRQNEQHRHPNASSESSAASAAEQIQTGTAGAASVAGLGASRFGPLSLDFDYNSPSSQTEPLPAFTPEQIATIARNKLELAVEYIELGDLSGARTLLQEVIESNDSATRQAAASLLSTLAPLS